jgi:NhaP-type Na+/H+ or K+/H+ antiporter/CRP-like cAMP-binding protein
MHSGPEVTIALLLCFVLTAGAAMRTLSGKIGLPYTVMMLLVGLLSGLGLAALHESSALPHELEAMVTRAPISPELIIFIFLPLLVFESSFATKVYAFRQDLGAILVLAVPVLLLSTLGIAALMVGLTSTSWAWGWLPALLFGALISATDPVAVVALLREAGAPKRLGVLIEGESLLNDGAAIAIFALLVGLLSGAGELGVSAAATHFLWLSAGGLLVGLALAMLVTGWLSRTFNSPLVEITLTLALAYGAMFLAEHVLHVSGVIAVVSAGLWMSARGRLQISPEVAQFLERFWEMLSYLANTLIFFLVGLVVATQVTLAEDFDLPLIYIAYLGIVALRFALIFLFRPLLGRVASPISPSEATVMAWGGLRGAVSLALALALAYHPALEAELGRQILLTTAGVALLTIIVNGTTTGWLLHALGLDEPTPGDRLADYAAEAGALSWVAHRVDLLSESRDLRGVDWSHVRGELSQRSELLGAALEATRRELRDAPSTDRIQGQWRQSLSMERRAIWRAFAEGTLSDEATRILDAEIDRQLDTLSGEALHPGEQQPHDAPSLRTRLAIWLGGRLPGLANAQFEQLALRYDLYRGRQLAAELVLRDLAERGEIDDDVRTQLRTAYRRRLHESKERLEDLRVHLPEITTAIETRLACRIQLNLERETYRDLAESGALDASRASEALADTERRMKALRFGATRMDLPETADLCRNMPLFAELDEAEIARIARLTHERAFGPGETLFEQGDEGRSMFVIARGAVAVYQTGAPSAQSQGEETLLNVLGGGDILGEMALLTGAPRVATARALTSAVVGEISRRDFEGLLNRQPGLERAVWSGFSERVFDNHVRQRPGYEQLGRAQRIAWFRRAEQRELAPGEVVMDERATRVFLIEGTLEVSGQRHVAPALIRLRPERAPRAEVASRVALLPPLLSASAREE